MDHDRHSGEACANQPVDKRRRIVRVHNVDTLASQQTSKLEAAQVLAEPRLVLAVNDRDAVGFHFVGQRPANTQTAHREPVALGIDVAAQVGDNTFHATDAHAEGGLHHVNTTVLHWGPHRVPASTREETAARLFTKPAATTRRPASFKCAPSELYAAAR